jgi:chromosomal replication initiator protein
MHGQGLQTIEFQVSTDLFRVPEAHSLSLFPDPESIDIEDINTNSNEVRITAPHPAISRESDNSGTDIQSSTIYSTTEFLTQRYTFDSFIVGKSNEFAYAASKAVAENPGKIYNPLFFYGGAGLGKTHLMHAIGHVAQQKGLNVLYVTSEKFTNQIINAIRFQQTDEFRARYRAIDILLIDDIQFIAGKESTEEEFFHTFNALYNLQKHIIVTSDQPPKAMHGLKDRLRSRFEWGLIADFRAPEYEHRLAILRSKSNLLPVNVPHGVFEAIARPEYSSVRELEGALNRVIAHVSLHPEVLTEQLVGRILGDMYTLAPRSVTLSLQDIVKGVCHYYNIDTERLFGKLRDREISWPRQIAMYLMREETNASLAQIGQELGGRDHTTILHGWEKVKGEREVNEKVKEEVASVYEAIIHTH